MATIVNVQTNVSLIHTHVLMSFMPAACQSYSLELTLKRVQSLKTWKADLRNQLEYMVNYYGV